MSALRACCTENGARDDQAVAHRRRALTRPEIAALQEVMQVVVHGLPDILAALSPSHRPLLANALLNLSVNHILAEEGGAVAASILQRLAAPILAGDRPAGGGGFRLNGQEA